MQDSAKNKLPSRFGRNVRRAVELLSIELWSLRPTCLQALRKKQIALKIEEKSDESGEVQCLPRGAWSQLVSLTRFSRFSSHSILIAEQASYVHIRLCVSASSIHDSVLGVIHALMKRHCNP